jgi:hypothetical protein
VTAAKFLAVGLAGFALSACSGTAPTLAFASAAQIVCSASTTELSTLQTQAFSLVTRRNANESGSA